MGKEVIDGLIVTPLKQIYNVKGDILHGIKRSDAEFIDFGEAYFTNINYNEIKGWNRHQKMTLNLIVPIGAVAFVIYDERENSTTRGLFWNIEVSLDNYIRLTIPPGVWLSFKGKSDKTNLILNIADIEHDPSELDKIQLDDISYNWDNL